MRLNSFLSIQLISSVGGRDERGNSLGAQAKWSDPIPCHIATNTDDRLGQYEDGIFHKASYNILTLPLKEFSTEYAEAKHVKLERRGIPLGEYDIMSLEAIETQNRLKIVV